jgi:DNA-binding CsgD family transcriptional regulator/tetratricopeptide (TPR) repeat protein
MTTILHPSRQAALETHLVGREDELARATSLLAESRPIAIAGAAGVGKSSLLRAAAAARGRPVYAGVCLRSLGWMPLLPLSHALGHELARDDPDAIAAAIAREVGDGTLVLDALHAADPDTLDVVARLAGIVSLGVAHRTPVAHQLDSLLERAGFAIITLAPLDPREATDLATLQRPRLRRARIDAVVERAGGLPGVLVELASAAEDPVRSEEAARWPVEQERRDPRRRALREEAERVRTALDPVVALRDRLSPRARRTVAEPAARPPFAALGDPHAVERAEEAWRAARGRGSGEAAARVALGEALFVGGDPSCLGHFEAVVRSLAEIDAEVVYEAAYGLVAGRYAFGDPASARELASEMASRARVGRDRRFEAIFRLTRAHLDLRVDGAYEAMIAEAHRVLAEAEGTPAGFQATLDMATAHAELGQDAQAVAACRLAARSAVGGPLVAMLAHSVGEIELAAGRPAAALVAAREARSASATGLIAADLARLTAGWAHLELGAGDPVAPLQKMPFPALAGAVPESAALAFLAAGDGAAAADSFQRAAQRWEGFSLARALRCRLGAGLAEIAQGRHVAARDHIEPVLRRARERGLTRLVERAERAMRRAGGPSSGLRALLSPGELTPRELDVMRLVRAGSTSARIADSLGIGRSTVDSHVRSAMAKTGARTRLQASMIAGQLERGEPVEVHPRSSRIVEYRRGPQIDPDYPSS